MTPNTNLCLRSIVKTMEQVIMPALSAADPLAVEQAAISVVHLKMMMAQSDYVPDYLMQCLADLIALGRALTAGADGGTQTSAAAQNLRDMIETASAPGQYLFTLGARRDAVAQGVDILIDASAVDGSATFLQRSQDLILDYGQRQSERDRAWYRTTNIDPEAATLPDPETLVSGWRPQGETHDPR